MTRPDYAREIRYALTDARALCERLGLIADRRTWKPQAGGVIVRCPWHQENTPSCSVRRAGDGTIAAKCFSCDASGDALSLVAAVRGLSLKTEFRSVLLDAAELAGLHSIVVELESGENQDRPAFVPPPVAPVPERTYPDAGELAALLADAGPCAEDPEVSAWLTSRALDPDRVDAAGGLAIREGQMLPRFASFQGLSWWETGHRLILPVCDVYGAVRSVRAARVIDGDSPKRLPPGGHKVSELVLACELGIAMLRGTYSPERLVVVEGEPDFLVEATSVAPRAIARIGIVSGSWGARFAEKVPVGCEVHICTHVDRAGDNYAEEIRQTLRRRGCFIRRWAPKRNAA